MERDPFNVELEMLRDFYEKWKSVHESRRAGHPQGVMARKAEELYEAHLALKTFDKPVILTAHG